MDRLSSRPRSRSRASSLPLFCLVAVLGFERTSQFDSGVVRLADGRWLVVFHGVAQDDSIAPAGAVVGRLFTAAGEPIGGDRVLNGLAEGNQHQPGAAPLPNGGFVVLWQDDCEARLDPADCSLPEDSRDGHLSGVFGRSFRTDGEPAGDDFLVPAVTFGAQQRPAVAANAAGDVVAVWQSRPASFDPDATAVWARRLTAPCAPDETTLCLGGGRFAVEVGWHDFFGNRGPGRAEARDDLWGTFWFFDPENLELAVKLIDGRAVNGHFWIFYGALSNVEYALRVTDTATGRVKLYENPSGTFASRGDTAAFAAGPEEVSAAAVSAVPKPSARPAAATGPCQPTATRLCLLDGRFAVEVAWEAPGGDAGPGRRLPLTDDTGAFWFFRADNPELMVKALDARVVNGRFWVFFGSLTDVAFELTVTDTATGESRRYENPQGTFASRGDTAAFPLPGGTATASAALRPPRR